MMNGQSPQNDDTPKYLAEWAAQVVVTLSAGELRDLIEEYCLLSRAQTNPAEDREHARLRLKALQKAGRQNP